MAMNDQGPPSRGVATYYQDYFELAFAAADMAAIWWQPLLKGIGRSQLEIASMQSRNGQSWLRWGHAMSAARSTADVMTANVVLCQSIANNYGDAMPKVSDALSQAAQTPVSIEVLTLPASRVRDQLVVPEQVDDNEHGYIQRRVA